MIAPKVIHVKHIIAHGIKPDEISHFDKPHPATSPQPLPSQGAHLSHSLTNEQILPTHKHVELNRGISRDYSNQETQNSQALYVEPVHVTVPITLNLVLTIQTELYQQKHSPFCSDEQIEQSSE